MDKKEVRTKYEQAQSHEEKIEIMKSLGEELTDEEIDDITAGKTGFCHWESGL